MAVDDVVMRRGREPVEETARAMYSGVNVSAQGVEHPRLSTADYAALQTSRPNGDGDGVFFYALSKLCSPGDPVWQAVTAVRCGVREPIDGGGLYTVQRTVIPRHVPKKDASRDVNGVRTYQLVQVLGDSYTRDLYGISKSTVATLRELAFNCPADAAATAEQIMRKARPDIKLRVFAGSIDKGPRAAKRFIREAAESCAGPPGGYDAIVHRDIMFLHIAAGVTVKGPVAHAKTVVDFAAIVERMGAHEAIHVFAVETATLGIDAYVNNECVASSIVGHVKVPGSPVPVPDYADQLDAANRVVYEALKRNILAVDDGDLGQVATALRVDRRAVLVNQHVAESVQELRIAGSDAGQSAVAGSDLWMYLVEGECRPWVHRKVEPGERVAIMYRDGLDVRLSPCFYVERFDGVHIISRDHSAVVQGMSGGALVAVRDMALLGVHRGQTRLSLLATAVDASIYQDVADYSGSRVAVASDDVIAGFETRGLRSQFAAVLAACQSVAITDNTATAIRVAGELLTTLPQDEALVPVWRNKSGLVNFCSSPGPSAPLRRSAEVGEQVVLVGVDESGPYTTTETITVKSVSPGGRNLRLSNFGAMHSTRSLVVVGCQDAAVLGLFVRKAVDSKYGMHGFAVGLPVGDVSRVDVLAGLSQRFPRLSTSAYDAVAVRRCFLHVSVSEDALMDQYATMGRSALQLWVSREAVAAGWSREFVNDQISAVLSTDRLADIAWRFELLNMVTAEEQVVALGRRVAAQASAAFFGIVYQQEGDRVFASVARQVFDELMPDDGAMDTVG